MEDIPRTRQRKLRPLQIVGDTALVPLTQGKVAVIDAKFAAEIGKHLWFFNGGYARRNQKVKLKDGSIKTTVVLLHVLLAGLAGLNAPEGFEIDHKNRNKLDNRIENLRVATICGNRQNVGRISTNTSGYKNISYRTTITSPSKWRVDLGFNGKRCSKSFVTLEEAIEWRDLTARELHGEYYVGSK